MKKDTKYRELIGRWCVPISKDCDTREELKTLRDGIACETRFAHLKSGKWILVRKLVSDDLKSLDFIKYIASFKIKNIKRLYK